VVEKGEIRRKTEKGEDRRNVNEEGESGGQMEKEGDRLRKLQQKKRYDYRNKCDETRRHMRMYEEIKERCLRL
jgi:hypothetical protein